MNFAQSIKFSILPCVLLLNSTLVRAETVDAPDKMEPQWIWTPVQEVGNVPNGACFFRRTFDVDRRSSVTLEIAADDSFEVYFNGKRAGQGGGWEHFTQLDLTKYTRVGKNTIAVKVVNRTPGYAGLVAKIGLGKQQAILTDSTWRTSTMPLSKWKQHRFADKSWRFATELGEWKKTEPWIIRQLPSARRVARSTPPKPERVEVVLDDSRVVLASGEEPLTSDASSDSKPQPLLLRPMEQAARSNAVFPADPDRPRWSTSPNAGGPQEIHNPFVKKRRRVATPTNVDSPAIEEIPKQQPTPKVQPLPDVEPQKTSTPTPAVSVSDAPVSQSRFAPVSGFSVEELMTGEQTGSLISASFNEFGQLLVSQENGPLLLCMDTNQDGTFDKIRPYCDLVTNCQGILALSGLAFVIADGPEGTGLYRLSDQARQGKLDTAVLLVGFDVSAQEHGPHGITLGPDGNLYVSCGNHATIKRKFSKLSPRQHLYEGDLIPRYEDPGGHANGVRLPAGFVLRTDTNGKKIELFASGLRNVYDLAFNADGELFAHDSDMESDMSTAWYRPTQVYHVPPGGEFGWRSGWAKWPQHFIDVVPPVAVTGRGSPTGAIVYNHYAYPAAFRDVIFLGDWSEGRILVAKPVRHGAGYKMQTDTFLEGKPLNVTDLEVGPDGMLYFVTGGRGTQGGVFRVKWSGKPNDQPIANGVQRALVAPQINSSWGRQYVAAIQQEMGAQWPAEITAASKNQTLPVEQRVQALQLMQWVGPLPNASLLLELSHDNEPRLRRFAAYLMSASANDERVPVRLVEMLSDKVAFVRRQACESLVRAHRSVPFEYVTPLLKSRDRAEAWAARLLLQLDQPTEWVPSALDTDDTRVFLNSATALMSAWPSEDHAKLIIERSIALLEGYLDDEEFVDLIRVLQLAVIRGDISPDSIPELRIALAEEFPANQHLMNRELIRLMVPLQVASIKDRYLDHLDSGLPEQERIHLATHLRFLKADWTMEEKFRLFKHLKPSTEAGNSVAGYMENVARDFSKGWNTDEEAIVLEQGALAPGAALQAVMGLPKELTQQQVRDLVTLDKSVTASDDTSKKLKVAILAVLARDGQEAAMAHLRKVYDDEPSRRVECVIGLAERPDGPNWPYLVKALEVVDGEVAREVIQKLQTVERSPTDSEPYRQVILSGFRLGNDGGSDAVRLLERWRGFASTAETPPWNDALKAWQNWFAQTYPTEPLPQLTQRKQREKWDYGKLLSHLGKSNTLRKASPERGQHVFVKAQCANCHQHGELGESMGPNLSALSNRFHMREIVESIIYPSKVISDQYKAKTLITDDGMTYTGIVGSGGVDALLVLQNDGKKVRVPTEAIEQTIPSKVSAMPEGLLDGLSLQEVTDLVAFLQQSPDSRMAQKKESSADSITQ